MSKHRVARSLLDSIRALNAFAKEVEGLGEVEEEVAGVRKRLKDLNGRVEKTKKELEQVTKEVEDARQVRGSLELDMRAVKEEAEKVLADARQQANSLIRVAEERVKEHEARMTRESARIKAIRNEAERAA